MGSADYVTGVILAAAAATVAGADPGGTECLDIIWSNQMVDPDCKKGSYGKHCDLFEIIVDGTQWASVHSDLDPLTVICHPGTVIVDQNGNCVVTNWDVFTILSEPVADIIGDVPCNQ